MFGELYHYPAGMHKKGTWIDVHEWDTGKYLGRIEQARQTYNAVSYTHLDVYKRQPQGVAIPLYQTVAPMLHDVECKP